MVDLVDIGLQASRRLSFAIGNRGGFAVDCG